MCRNRCFITCTQILCLLETCASRKFHLILPLRVFECEVVCRSACGISSFHVAELRIFIISQCTPHRSQLSGFGGPLQEQVFVRIASGFDAGSDQSCSSLRAERGNFTGITQESVQFHRKNVGMKKKFPHSKHTLMLGKFMRHPGVKQTSAHG